MSPTPIIRYDISVQVFARNLYWRTNAVCKWGRCLVGVWMTLASLTTTTLGASVDAKIVWIEGKPSIELAIDAKLTEPAAPIVVPLSLFDSQNTRLWQTQLSVPTTGPAPWKLIAPLEKITDVKKQHRVDIGVRDADRELNYAARITLLSEKAMVSWFGISSFGIWPKRKVEFLLPLPAFKGQTREVPVAITVRDGDDAIAFQRESRLTPAEVPQLHRLDLSPDTSTSVGPYSVDVDVDSESHGLSFRTSERFAQPNAQIPVSGFETGDPTLWFAADGQPQKYSTGGMYYSEHLRDLLPRDYPKIAYDAAEKHGGRQALRIDYESAREAYVWSRQMLPGKPLAMSLWVKGNGSDDQLVVYFEDHINFTLPAWQRNANFEQATICSLNFEGWKQFAVPVLGAGLQVTGTKGSTVEIDGPVKVLALVVRTAKPKGKEKEPPVLRSVWIDDVVVQTQVPSNARLSIETQLNRTDGELAPGAILAISVGNGYATKLAKGKVALTARDAEGQGVWTSSVDLPIETNSFSAANVPLDELVKRQPRGPVDLDVTFTDASVSGARISKRVTLKRPLHAGVVFDFEQQETYNGFQPGKVTGSHSQVVSGGAEGSKSALALAVVPKQEDNSVLLHPALPGKLDRVEVMIHGNGQPVQVQPWFIDSGATGIWLRNYNLFYAEPIKVDWNGWRKVTIASPPIPATHGEKNKTYLFEPAYPLNLAFNATLLEGEEPTELRFDNIRVLTHLPAADVQQLEIDYPDESRIHAPGAPLTVTLTNFAPEAVSIDLQYSLQQYQGYLAKQDKQNVKLAAGERRRVTLVDKLSAGVFDVEVKGFGKQAVRLPIMVLDAAKYFGGDSNNSANTARAMLADPLALRRSLGLMTERLYLDWDNTEPAPYLRHFYWFDQETKKRREFLVLPEQLKPFAEKQQAAAAAVAQAEQAIKSAQTQVTQMLQTEKQAAQKIANTEKSLEQPKAALEAALKQVAEAQKKFDVAEADLKVAMEVHSTAAKELDATVTEQKSTSSQLANATKAILDAEKKLKVAESTVKSAESAVSDAEKKAAAASKDAAVASSDGQKADAAREEAKKTLDKLQDDNDAKEDEKKAAEKKLKELSKSADSAAAKIADTKKQLDAAQGALKSTEAKRTEARTAVMKAATEVAAAKLMLDTLQKKLATLADVLKSAQSKAAQAKKAFEDKQKPTQQAKQDLSKALQAQQQAEKKLQDGQKQLDNDRQNLAAKEQSRRDVEKSLEEGAKTLIAARQDLAAMNSEYEQAKLPLGVMLDPVVGFSADWAGPEARDAIAKGTYSRYIPNMLQAPEKLVDWSLFVREIQREYKGRFDRWVFWENPDLEQAPQTLPPDRYRPLLETFHRWVKLYNPHAKVVAGGFNFDKALQYFGRIPDAHTLPFDEIAVQMNVGELSPEAADMEGFLDDLNALLKLRETRRVTSITELDWGISEYTSALQQAAYHARAAMILQSRNASPHQFNLVNTGFELAGYGMFYRLPYGNSAELQTFKPSYVPKPAYFAMIETRRFLKEWQFLAAVSLPGRSLEDQRAFVYRNQGGRLAAAIWRTQDGERVYRTPANWQKADAADTFGVPVSTSAGLRITALPLFVFLPEDYKLEQLLEELRYLEATDGSHGVLLDLHLSEAESRQRAGYKSKGGGKSVEHSGVLPGGRKLRESFATSLEEEEFTFNSKQPGNLLLRRRWYFDGQGESLFIKLNNGTEQAWNLGSGQDNSPGVREGTWVLRDCKAGENKVIIRYAKPGGASGYRVEPLSGDYVPLVRWGAINSKQTKGQFLSFTNVTGGALSIAKTNYQEGIGTHSTSFVEYPLAKQFDRFEVTVGIDGSTEGRGSVVFRIYVDGQVKADSGVINGFNPAKTLTVEKLSGAERLIISVTDAGDGDRHDLANWVDGKFFLRAK